MSTNPWPSPQVAPVSRGTVLATRLACLVFCIACWTAVAWAITR